MKTTTVGSRAPEVVNLKPHTYALDVFSMGCIFFNMMTGKMPRLTDE